MGFRLYSKEEKKKKENVTNVPEAWLVNILANNLLKVIAQMLMKCAKTTAGEVSPGGTETMERKPAGSLMGCVALLPAQGRGLSSNNL